MTAEFTYRWKIAFRVLCAGEQNSYILSHFYFYLVTFLSLSHNAWYLQHIWCMYMLSYSCITVVHIQLVSLLLHLCLGILNGEECGRTMVSCHKEVIKKKKRTRKRSGFHNPFKHCTPMLWGPLTRHYLLKFPFSPNFPL